MAPDGTPEPSATVIDHLRAVHESHGAVEADLARLSFLRMRLARKALGDGVSEFHIAEMLGVSPADVRSWTWR